jgi:hypothetical protein
VNILGLDGESLLDRWSTQLYNLIEETSIVVASVDGTDGNGGGGGWHTVHPLWMDVMEEVVWMGGLWVHPLRMHGIRKMLLVVTY